MKIRRLLTCFFVLAVTLMATGPAPAQSPDAMAAAKELMATMKSVDQFKVIMPALMKAM